jgi:osmoprotectant transport system ATP-binding protein
LNSPRRSGRFLGPSGCGKTTLLRLTNRLDTLTRGNIFVKEQNILDVDPVKLRQQIGYVIQEIGLFPNKTVADNIAVVPKLLGWPKDRIRDRVDELLRLVRLEPETYRRRYPAELSGASNNGWE